jgi:hypothetical protein
VVLHRSLAPLVVRRLARPRPIVLANALNSSHDDDSVSRALNADDAAAAMANNAAAAARVEQQRRQEEGNRFGLGGVMGTVRGLKARVIGEKEPDVEISAPRDFRHLSSIGWTPENGFEIRNIPPEWRKLFQAAGVKKSELKDKDTAAFVMDIIQKEGGVELLQGGGGGARWLVGGGDARNFASAVGTRAPCTANAAHANAPKAPMPPPAPKRVGAAAPATGGVRAGGLLDQIKQGKELKSVDNSTASDGAATVGRRSCRHAGDGDGGATWCARTAENSQIIGFG